MKFITFLLVLLPLSAPAQYQWDMRQNSQGLTDYLQGYDQRYPNTAAATNGTNINIYPSAQDQGMNHLTFNGLDPQIYNQVSMADLEFQTAGVLGPLMQEQQAIFDAYLKQEVQMSTLSELPALRSYYNKQINFYENEFLNSVNRQPFVSETPLDFMPALDLLEGRGYLPAEPSYHNYGNI